VVTEMSMNKKDCNLMNQYNLVITVSTRVYSKPKRYLYAWLFLLQYCVAVLLFIPALAN